MLIPQFTHCADSPGLSITIPIASDLIGIAAAADYWVYLLSHEEDTRTAHLHELVLLPVSPEKVDKFYSVRIRLENRPKATFKALEVLSELNIDVRHCNATDCVAGFRGMLEASIVVPNGVTIDDINDRFISLSSTDIGRFVTPHSHTPDGKPIFVKSYSFEQQYQHFEKKRNHTLVRPFKADLARKSQDDSTSYLCFKINKEVLEYINKQYDRDLSAPLSDYRAAITAEPRFALVSVSFLNPEESIVLWKASIRSARRAEVLTRIASFLGDSDVNFRILSAKHIQPEEDKLSVDLYCDLSHTEYQIYAPATLAWIHSVRLSAKLRGYQESQIDGVEVEIDGQYGYGTESQKLSHFKPWDMFQVLWFGLISARGDAAGSVYVEPPMKFDEDSRYLPQSAELSEVIKEWSASAASNYDELLKYKDITCTVQPPLLSAMARVRHNPRTRVQEIITPTLTFAKDEKGNIVTMHLMWDSRGSDPTIPTASDDMCIHLWMRRSGEVVYGLAARNTPPKNILDEFNRAIDHADNHTNADAKAKAFATETLRDLSYEFPSIDAFRKRGQTGIHEDMGQQSVTRFVEMGIKYPREKSIQDRFPFEGNWRLGEYLADYWQEEFGRIDDGKRDIVLVDIGVASGAITTVFMLDCLRRIHTNESWKQLVGRLKVVLVDIAEGVLDDCKKARVLPTTLEFRVRGDILPKTFVLKTADCQKLFQDPATVTLNADAINLPPSLHESADIVVSGFCHHHLNDTSRMEACRQMARIVRPGGFIGVTDESLTHQQYISYRMNHLRNSEETALESFLQTVEEHANLFSDTGVKIVDKRPKLPGDRCYTFWGIKQGSLCKENRVRGVIEDAEEWIKKRGPLPYVCPRSIKQEAKGAPGLAAHDASRPLGSRNVAVISIVSHSEARSGIVLPPDMDRERYVTQCREALHELEALPRGRPGAMAFEELVGKVLRLCFGGVLANPEPKVRDIAGVVVRDWMVANVAEHGFWGKVRQRYEAMQIIWECKNYDNLCADDFQQINYYLTSGIAGRFGVIASRGRYKEAYMEHQRRIATGGRFVLVVSERDLEVFLSQAESCAYSEEHIQNLYSGQIRRLG